MFEVIFFQSFKLKRILHTDYLTTVVTFQNGYISPLSRIQVCHSSRVVTPVHTLLTTQLHPEPVATSSGLYSSHQIAETIELHSIVPTNLSHPLSSNVTLTQTPTAPHQPLLIFCIPISSIELRYGHLVYLHFIQYIYNLHWFTITFHLLMCTVDYYLTFLI